MSVPDTEVMLLH